MSTKKLTGYVLIRIGLITILTLFLLPIFGQTFIYPSLNKTGTKISDFIPIGWTVLDSSKGDLNKDGIDDAVIILQHKDSVSILDEEDTVLTQPRILAILFKNPSNKQYRLIESSNTFILSHINSRMDDPYQSISIKKGILRLEFQLFYTMGSWYTTNSNYQFRYNGKEFTLIGAKLSSIHRASLDYEDYDFNFLTRKYNYTKGNESKGTSKILHKDLPIQKPITFKTFEKPFSLEIDNDIFL